MPSAFLGLAAAAAMASAFPAVQRPVADIVSPTWGDAATRDAADEVGQIAARLGIHTGMTIADIGAGDGYDTLRLSKVVGSGGRVIAEDVTAPYLATLRTTLSVAMAPADIRAEVAEQVRRISRLADDLLDYAKPWRLEPVPLDMAARVAAATCHRPGVQLGAGLRQPLPGVADPRRLDQALANLLDNAQAAGGRVEVDGDGADGAVRLHVCDDGPGIPDDIRDRLFQPFVSRRAGGTGLGLAIVAKIIEAHGGTVALTQRPGWTTCFTIFLPNPAVLPNSA